MPEGSDDFRTRRIERTREFFGARAAGWETRFPDDEPRYQQAVSELAPLANQAALDAGCGTGRALPYLRDAVGPAGLVVGLDLTPEMLYEARRRHPAAATVLVLGDALRLPFRSGAFDVVLAAGLISHLADPEGGLRELGRVCRPGARLALFHPIGRAALGRRHGRELAPDDIRAEQNVRTLLGRADWRPISVDDAEDRYLVLASRQ
jgi:SAM-dependent methyltransferase